MFTENSTIDDILKNPLGEDIITTVIGQLGIPRLSVHNPITTRLTLKQLKFLSRGALDDDFIAMLCHKMAECHDLKIPPARSPVERTWWKEAVAYQIYPRSFMDSNGDGVGDLQGIISRLDYLKDLGITLLWLSPIYDSPNDDNGYDIRDYRKIMAEFGTMDDFQQLLDQAHEKGIRLIMDLVVNHTSDEHAWFQSAKESEESPYREYYMWEKGTKEAYPNNWTSFFSGSAWNYYDQTQTYGLHLFSKKQMDLNWSYEPMRQAIYEMIRFWLDKGIDGFRLDVINFISKEKGLPQGTNLVGDIMGQYGAEHYFFGPHLHDYLSEMRRETFSHYDVVTIGETPGIGLNLSELLTHKDRKELDMVFNFEHLDQLGKSNNQEEGLDLNHVKNVFIRWQTDYNRHCWNSVFYDNHDNPRMLSKIDPKGIYRQELGKLLGLLQMTLKGTPFIYQGQELGLVNGLFDSIDDYRDVESINLYKSLIAEGKSEEEILATLKTSTRDHARIVMPWSDGPGRGFTTGQPWIAASIEDDSINCEAELADPRSIYHFYKKMIGIRQAIPDLVYGEFEVVYEHKKDYFGYYRHGDERTFFIDMNLSDKTIRAYEPTHQYEFLLGNYPTTSVLLRPYECRLFEVML